MFEQIRCGPDLHMGNFHLWCTWSWQRRRWVSDLWTILLPSSWQHMLIFFWSDGSPVWSMAWKHTKSRCLLVVVHMFWLPLKTNNCTLGEAITLGLFLLIWCSCSIGSVNLTANHSLNDAVGAWLSSDNLVEMHQEILSMYQVNSCCGDNDGTTGRVI